MKTEAFYRMVQEALAEQHREEVERGTAAVFHALRDRLTREEAAQVAAQLPMPLKAVWFAGECAGRRPIKLDRAAFYTRVMREARLASIRDARWMTLAVFAALKEQLSPGEADDVLAQLPEDLKEVWLEAGTASVTRRAIAGAAPER
jgi:uncharacterized protein (DUF2267 family)